MKIFEEDLYKKQSKTYWIIVLYTRGFRNNYTSYVKDIVDSMGWVITSNNFNDAKRFKSKKEAQLKISLVERSLETSTFCTSICIQKVKYTIETLETDQLSSINNTHNVISQHGYNKRS